MNKKWLLSLMVMLVGVFAEVQATPIFASQYNLKCTTCHSMVPTLNKTGLMFMRNGFRFSKNDKTLAEAFLDANSSTDRVIPVHGLVGISVDTESRSDVENLNLYFAGSVTNTLSFYSATRSTYNMPVDNDLFSEANSVAFMQWNPKGDAHALKLGWMDPLAMFSNLNRTMMDTGVMGSGLLKKAPKSIVKPEWVSTPVLPEAPGPDATAEEIQAYNLAIMPKQPYKLPVSYAGVGLVKGVEYSYLYNDKALFLVNYGIPSSPSYADSDDSELTLGFEIRDIIGYNFGLIYMHQEIANIETDSYILPIEKEFFNGQLLFQQSFVYKDTNQFENPYYGSQTTLTYQIDDESQLRAIFSIDQDEAEETGSGFSLTYSKLWNDKFLLHVIGARHNGEVFDDSILKVSFNMFF